MARTFATAEAFRNALEGRLNQAATSEQIPVNRLRRQVAFDRLLARLFRVDPAPWVLKGGYALELRFKTARTTLDIDLTVPRVDAGAGDDTNQIVRDMLQQAAGYPTGDWLEYTIGPPVMDLGAAPYGGARYSVVAVMGGRVFARFHLDAGIGDAVIQPVEAVECRDWLAFAGVPSPVVRAISKEQQFAEKLHAYTLPRDPANSRVKDLVDLAILVRSGDLAPVRTTDAVRLTFERRQTHRLPTELLRPPREWQARFQSLAHECELPEDMGAAFATVETFFDRIKDRQARS